MLNIETEGVRKGYFLCAGVGNGNMGKWVLLSVQKLPGLSGKWPKHLIFARNKSKTTHFMRIVTVLLVLSGLGSLFSCAEDERLTLTASEETVTPGNRICVDVSAENFENILTMQYSIGWDDEVLRFIEVTNFGLPGLSAQNFGRPADHSDRLTVSWFEPNLAAVTIPDNSVLFSVCYEAVGQSGASCPVTLTDQPTIVEIANAREEVLSPVLLEGSITVK